MRKISAFLLLFALAACSNPSGGSGNAMPTTPSGVDAGATSVMVCEGGDCSNPQLTATPLPPMRFVIPTPGAEPISAWRPPLYPVPWALSTFDHFYFIRPIEADQINWPLANYRYGGTFISDDVVHTGVDIDAEKGTPIHAAAPGTVVWAGWGFFSGDPNNTSDPYGIAAVIKHDFGYADRALYTVYAHMDSINVSTGQWVDTGAVLGRVGETGFTTGPHLHFEVRLGTNSYYYTRNPELWIAPPQGWGVLVGQVLKRNGEQISEMDYKVVAESPRRTWFMRTYGKGAANSDDYYKENTVLSDLPAGKYIIEIPRGDDTFKSYNFEVEIFPGRVTFFRYTDEIGFSTNLPKFDDSKLDIPKP
jgi:murein DD-endopeptidase MepM/ murein hydrolase activator NlpD